MKKNKLEIANYLYSITELLCDINKVVNSIVFSFALVICIFSSSSSNAQSSDSLIIIEPSKKSIKASNEELIDLVLKVVNRKKIPLIGVISINLESSMNLISRDKIAVNIQSGDSMFIPVKVFITKKTTSGKDHVIRFDLSETANKLLLTTETKVQVLVNRNVNMFSLLSSILLDITSDSIRIPIRISNSGNTSQRITLINRFPPLFQSQDFHSSLEIILPSSTDTLITITKPVTRKMFDSEGFDVTFTGLYSNGDVFGMAYVRVQSGRSDRVYRDPLQTKDYNTNSISLSSQGMFSTNQSFLLYGQGDLELKSGKLGYSLDYTKWQDSYSPAMMRNTWIRYESNNIGITAGNISKNMDINLNGRGANLFLNNANNKDTYEFGYLDGNQNLIGQDFYSFMPSGSAAWAGYTRRKENSEFATSLIYEINPLMNANSVILGNTYTFPKFKGLRLQASLSAGNTSQYYNSSVAKVSVASGLTIAGTINKIAISSSNYFSTSYFPGMRRGALSFNERITWLRKRSNVWAGFDYNYYAPKTFNAFQLYMPKLSTMRAEVGMSGTFFKKMVASVSPLFFKETNNAFQLSGLANVVHTLSYWNINASLNYPIANNHYLSINTESGYYTTSFEDKTRFHFRSNLNYKKGIFNLSSNLQLGTFYIGEAANSFVRSQKSARVVSLIPTFRKSFFASKLRTEAGLAFMNNSSFGNSNFFTGKVEYDVLPKTSFYSSINHNRFNGYQFSLLEIGLTQKLSLPKVGAINSDLEVMVYQDMNQNNIFDQGDVKVNNHLVYINNLAFISNSNGSVVYKKLPLDNYHISSHNYKGWFAPDQYIKLEKEKHRIEIPLKRTGSLKGSLVFSFDQFSYEIDRNLQGIVVVATDENNMKYMTKADLDGQIIFYLPVGKYKLAVDGANLPPEVEVEKNISVVVLDTENPQSITINLRIKPRKIEAKKFTSPNKFSDK